ncbi:hypothetical protein QOM21_36935 [Streptomyces sp. Pv4-95]|uniref:hypothetical protein n=1 Tax=Streptomyces sp. Pv4-95 TaxID=3049543 RepID=UPI003891C784
MLDGGLELLVRVGLTDSDDPDELDDATLSLRRLLDGLPEVGAHEVRSGQAPSGSKGAALELGAMAVTVLGAHRGLRVLVDAVRVWVHRADNRKVIVQLGDDSVEIHGMSPEQTAELAESFIQRRSAE